MLTQSLFEGWKDSCNFLGWSELRLILLASANTLRRSFFLVARYGTPFIALATVLHAFAHGSWRDCIYQSLEIYSNPVMIAAQLSWALVMFITVMSIRASLEAKTANYYLPYLGRLPFFFMLSYLPPHYSLFLVQWFTVFFFLDDVGSPFTAARAAYNGFKLFVCYLPLMISITIPFGLLYLGGNFLLNFIIPSSASLGLFNAVRFLLFYGIDLVLLSFLAICYLKIKHSNYKLFFS